MAGFPRRRLRIALVLVTVLCAPSGAVRSDDTALFSTAVPPNVLLIVDNSLSMNHIVWHPAFDPDTPDPRCNTTNGGLTDFVSYDTVTTLTLCGTTRMFVPDPAVTAESKLTHFDHRYVNWVHALDPSIPAEATILDEIGALDGSPIPNDGTYSPCLQAEGFTTFSKYGRSRASAAKDVLREVICNVNQSGTVRFGLAQFRLIGSSYDPNGGFVRVPIRDLDDTTYTLNGTSAKHLDHLGNAIDALEGESYTPLAETLFQIYTYFMGRSSSERPAGFPAYSYRTTLAGNYGPYTSTSSYIPGSPVQYDCQKNFVVIITDGEPTKDDFDVSNVADNTAIGFSSFGTLVGDYIPGDETEVGGAACVGGSECALYLDDLAKFMATVDFRPDMTGDQFVDVYTVGFTTSSAADDLLRRTAAAGNGLFRKSNNAEQLTQALITAITDIVAKSQTFTAATVPATRTAAGGNFYASIFRPLKASPFWEGHLRLLTITKDGDILDQQGDCALEDPSPPGECKSGVLSPSADDFWDAGEEISSPDSRRLYTSLASSPPKVAFDTSLGVAELGDPADVSDDLTLADAALYPGSNATTAEELADEIIQNVRGCVFGDVGPGCSERPWLLGDMFHSNPLVVGPPRGFVQDPSYSGATGFKATYNTRDKVIYGGANDGFLRGFLTGEYDPALPGYDRGTGEELFGFMPWPARRNIRYLPIDDGSRDYYFVDGSPVAADVWFYTSATQTTKLVNGSEWHTVLMGGLRQGGNSYYALDVTDPSSASYPEYLWEFPAEDAPAALKQYFGETWGEPILTRVKVDIGGLPYERWVAVVTGGYDPSGDPNDPLNYNVNATAGRAIFLVDVKTGEILAEKRFDPAAPAGDPEAQMTYAFASTPGVFDLNGNGDADVIYVGDLGGNMWKWVIAYDKLNPAGANYLEDPINDGGDVAQPNTRFRKFFSVPPGIVGGIDYYRSFFFPPAGTFKSGTLWLSFGSGERANLKRPGDSSSDADNNRFYSMTDLDPFERSTIPYATLGEADLYDATNDGSCASLGGFRGYLFKARDAEKFVTNVDVYAFQVLAASFTPTPAGAVDICSGAGDAALYVFRIYCGEGYFPGTDGDTRRLELGVGMPTDPRVSVSEGGTRVIVTQQAGEAENEVGPDPLGAGLGQLYWRERTQ